MRKTLRSLAFSCVLAFASFASGNTDPNHCSNVEGKTCSQRGAQTYCYWMNEYGGDFFTYLCTCQYDNYRQDWVWICYCSSCP